MRKQLDIKDIKEGTKLIALGHAPLMKGDKLTIVAFSSDGKLVGLRNDSRQIDGWGNLDGLVAPHTGVWIAIKDLSKYTEILENTIEITGDFTFKGKNLKGKKGKLLHENQSTGETFIEFDEHIMGGAADGLGKAGHCAAVPIEKTSLSSGKVVDCEYDAKESGDLAIINPPDPEWINNDQPIYQESLSQDPDWSSPVQPKNSYVYAEAKYDPSAIKWETITTTTTTSGGQTTAFARKMGVEVPKLSINAEFPFPPKHTLSWVEESKAKLAAKMKKAGMPGTPESQLMEKLLISKDMYNATPSHRLSSKAAYAEFPYTRDSEVSKTIQETFPFEKFSDEED